MQQAHTCRNATCTSGRAQRGAAARTQTAAQHGTQSRHSSAPVTRLRSDASSPGLRSRNGASSSATTVPPRPAMYRPICIPNMRRCAVSCGAGAVQCSTGQHSEEWTLSPSTESRGPHGMDNLPEIESGGLSEHDTALLSQTKHTPLRHHHCHLAPQSRQPRTDCQRLASKSALGSPSPNTQEKIASRKFMPPWRCCCTTRCWRWRK